MSDFYAPATTDDAEKEHLKVLDQVWESGVNFFDTADIYGCGRNEQLVGKFMKGKPREKIFVATKFGVVRDETAIKGICGKANYVKQACETSLKYLELDYIDLYYYHRMDPTTPIEETVGAMAELVQEGKVKYLGLSECGPSIIRRAHKVHPISAVQIEYSLWTRDIEGNGVIDTCRELGIAIVPYSPLGRGFLTGRYKSPDDFEEHDYRKSNPRFQGENFTKNLALVDKLKEVAERKKVTPAQLALAWILEQGDDMFPIPGTTREKNARENNESVKVKLTASELNELKEILDQIPVVGGRYDERSLNLIAQAF
eukprot:TRINITY_DN2353_c0_g1_i2.p1 TRINITY_DN2353_c0_g1~~TRINITY_DN2353_c0_g1_i2.p1  ORF type:complete len:347 (-),score=104.70 TRINITY_DN2353_c0_g1_i2:64-1005(-)